MGRPRHPNNNKEHHTHHSHSPFQTPTDKQHNPSSQNKTQLVKIPTCLRLQPKFINTDPSSKTWTLRLLAKPHSNSHHKTPTKVTSRQQMSHENATRELAVYKIQNYYGSTPLHAPRRRPPPKRPTTRARTTYLSPSQHHPTLENLTATKQENSHINQPAEISTS